MQNLALLVLKPDFWRINWFRRETSFGEENGVPQSCCKDETQCQSDQVLWDRENPTIVQVCLLDMLLLRCSMFIFLVINLCLLQTCWPHRLGAFICLVSPPTICLWFSPPLPQFLLSRSLFKLSPTSFGSYDHFLCDGCRWLASVLPAAWGAQTGSPPGSNTEPLLLCKKIFWGVERFLLKTLLHQ